MVKAFSAANLAIIFFGTLIWIIYSKSYEPLIVTAAIALHEAGHLCASAIYGNKFKKLSFQAGGLRLSGNRFFTSYSAEAIIAFAGPFFNLVCALAFLDARSESGVFFKQVSVALAILNLLPISGFDGARITECFLSIFMPQEAVLKVCDILSFFVLFSIWCIAVYLILRTGRNLSIYLFTVMIFLRMTAKSSRERICKITRG